MSAPQRSDHTQATQPGPYERYAIFYAPEPQSALDSFAYAWFDYAAAAEASPPVHDIDGLDAATLDRAIQFPRRYGVHATLKAPFRPRSEVSCAAILTRVEAFARNRSPIVTGPLQLTELGGFLALCPTGRTRPLEWLAALCMTAFDDFRDDLDATDRARREPHRLTPAQRLLLEDWGYPYVLSEFRFHITLTGKLSERDRALLLPALAPMLRDVCTQPFDLRSICLFGDPGGRAPFERLGQFPLEGTVSGD